MNKHYKHVRQHALKHQAAEMRLKNLINHYVPKKEKVATLFIITFLLVLGGLIVFRNREVITKWWESRPDSIKTIIKEKENVKTNGIKTGVESVIRIENQVTKEHKKNETDTEKKEYKSEEIVIEPTKKETIKASEKTIKETIWMTNYLGHGQNLTTLNQTQTKALQKSIIATYYLGEKTIDINSILQTDIKLLQKINNTLSVDLFAYLNQAENRADSLDDYLNLLNALKIKTDQRIADLQNKVNFLSANFKGKEQELKISEQTFFNNLKSFNGPNAEEALAKFIGVEEGQTEIRAKAGAYDSLKKYYQFFKPKIENLIQAITANRDALIAGVKVTEIQNMTLPLINKQ